MREMHTICRKIPQNDDKGQKTKEDEQQKHY